MTWNKKMKTVAVPLMHRKKDSKNLKTKSSTIKYKYNRIKEIIHCTIPEGNGRYLLKKIHHPKKSSAETTCTFIEF